MEEKVIQVSVSENETFTEWLRKKLQDKLTNRYKVYHMAEDMDINPVTLYRFMKGAEVRTQFYDRAFSYLFFD